jgi:pSer/pThr/pTyr-binding forkhead associated (FHA) protein
MPKMIVSIDGVVIKEVQLTKDRTTLGRRPYNDIVIDNLAVSGEHAAVQVAGLDVTLEDLNSTNGTYVNGKAVTKQRLQHNDTIEIGKYTITFLSDEAGLATHKPPPLSHEPVAPVLAPDELSTAVAPLAGEAGQAVIRVLNGAASGREVPLVKVVTTIGKPGVAVAAITRRPQGFVVAHVDGASIPTLNGSPIRSEPLVLKSGDLLELGGIQMRFVQT